MTKEKIKSNDHTGREFVSITKMCQFWEISEQLYRSRLKAGWSVEKALTTPKSKYEKCFKTNHEKYRGMDINFIAYIFKSGYGISREEALQKAREHAKWVKIHKFSEL